MALSFLRFMSFGSEDRLLYYIPTTVIRIRYYKNNNIPPGVYGVVKIKKRFCQCVTVDTHFELNLNSSIKQHKPELL